MAQLTSRHCSPTVKVVEAVADEKGVATDELPPLYDTIESDALNALFSRPSGDGGCDCYVKFQYQGCSVTVHSNGTVDVEPLDER